MLQNGQLMGPITIMTQPNNFAASKSPPTTQPNTAPSSTTANMASSTGQPGPNETNTAIKTEVYFLCYFRLVLDNLFRSILGIQKRCYTSRFHAFPIFPNFFSCGLPYQPLYFMESFLTLIPQLALLCMLINRTVCVPFQPFTQVHLVGHPIAILFMLSSRTRHCLFKL